MLLRLLAFMLTWVDTESNHSSPKSKCQKSVHHAIFFNNIDLHILSQSLKTPIESTQLSPFAQKLLSVNYRNNKRLLLPEIYRSPWNKVLEDCPDPSCAVVFDETEYLSYLQVRFVPERGFDLMTRRYVSDIIITCT